MSEEKLIDLSFKILFTREDANFDVESGRLDLPEEILNSQRCASGKCKKRDKCVYHKLRGRGRGTKVCQSYIKFKYKGETFPEVSEFSDNRYEEEIFPLILRVYECYK